MILLRTYPSFHKKYIHNKISHFYMSICIPLDLYHDGVQAEPPYDKSDEPNADEETGCNLCFRID